MKTTVAVAACMANQSTSRFVMNKVSNPRSAGRTHWATGAIATLIAMGLGSGITWGANSSVGSSTSTSTINVTATIPHIASLSLGGSSGQQSVNLSPSDASDSGQTKDVTLSLFCNSSSGCSVTVQAQDATGTGNEKTTDFQLTPSGVSQQNATAHLTTTVHVASKGQDLTFDTSTGEADISPASNQFPGTVTDTLTITVPFAGSSNATVPAGTYAGNLIVTVTAN